VATVTGLPVLVVVNAGLENTCSLEKTYVLYFKNLKSLRFRFFKVSFFIFSTYEHLISYFNRDL